MKKLLTVFRGSLNAQGDSKTVGNEDEQQVSSSKAAEPSEDLPVARVLQKQQNPPPEENNGGASSVNNKSEPSEAAVPSSGGKSNDSNIASNTSNISNIGNSLRNWFKSGVTSSSGSGPVKHEDNTSEKDISPVIPAMNTKETEATKKNTPTAPPTVAKAVPPGLHARKAQQQKQQPPQQTMDKFDNWLLPPYQYPLPNQCYRQGLDYYHGATFTHEQKLHLLTEGYTIAKQVIPSELVQNALQAIDEMIQQENELIHYVGKKINREQLSPRMKIRIKPEPYFLSGVVNHIDILALYYNSPVYHMVEDLLHNHSGKNERNPPFRRSVHCAQMACRYPQPPSNSGQPSFFKQREKLGGRKWHVDGLDNGFSILVGIALNDQINEFSGNLCLHPGTHFTLLPYLRACFHQMNTPDQTAKKEIPRPDLGEPIQVMVNAGDVIFALHKLAHFGGPNYSPDVRKMIYYRVSHCNHTALKAQSFDNIWVEFEGMQELARM
jgi:hypothetical protein